MAPFEDALRALAAADVRFVVAGGVAVVLQGHPRLTVDLDVVVDLEEGNLRAALRVLTGMGLQPRLPVPAEDFADPGLRQQWVRDRGLMVFSMHDPSDPRREVDLFATAPLPFEQLWEHADEITLASTTVRVACIADLLAMKRAAGRPQDLADVAALEELREQR